MCGCTQPEDSALRQLAGAGGGSNGPRASDEVITQCPEAVEPVFSKIQVFAASGKDVDKGDVHLDSSNPALLKVSLPPLGAGTYKVVWRVVSVDTHVTKGNFTFRIDR